ncbi:response regulator transcription factor [Alicyclobacillus fastidiosus]|uniref:Response regulator transcription factor n=1 Tax=Alicyclobacillus fastidiosus TaxID=392011 RepID=A0ABV5AHN5_9BACL|nr:response regulator transcription factor [Alicyclobacillus fastidiosus]WEH09231.1 response regulator transcription factor [Alicyclobacillus fastidiosus]
MTDSTIRILIAEDQTLVRGALATLLNFEDDFEVVATAGDGIEALALAKVHRPHVVLVDVEMPHMSGLEVVEQLHQALPDCKAIVVTTFARPGYMQRAVKAGARGYLLKDAHVEELAGAIRRIVQGGRVMSPELMMAAMEHANPLSDREAQVLRLAANGMSTRQIAMDIALTEGTVRNYLSEAISKLNASSRQEAIKLAESQGWI